MKSTWKIINLTTFAANFPIDLVSLFGTFMRLTHKNYLVGTMWTAASGLVSSSCPSPVRTRLCAGSRAPWTRPTGHSTTGRGHTPVRHTASDYVLSLVVPDSSIFGSGSSFNALFFCLNIAPFLSPSISWHPIVPWGLGMPINRKRKHWSDIESEKDNYIYCFTQQL